MITVGEKIRTLRGIDISRFFMFLFLICFPFQIRTLLYDPNLFFGGAFNVYSVFFVHVGDVFLILSLIFYGVSYYRDDIESVSYGEKNTNILLMAMLLTLIGSVFFAESKILAFISVIRFMLLGVVYFMIVSEVVTRREIMLTIAIGVGFQSLMAIAQFGLQHSVGLRFLGESVIGEGIKGVAKIDIGNDKIVRAYGTFAHPNILGGFLVVGIWLLIDYIKRCKWALIVLILAIMALVLTFSRSAFVALIGGGLTYFSVIQRKIDWKYPILFVSIVALIITMFDLNSAVVERLLLFHDDAGSQRMEYVDVSKNMFFGHPFGVGIGNFTGLMQDFTEEKMFPWLMQPVHNVFLLVLNESGWVAMIVFLLIIGRIFMKTLRINDFQNKMDKDLACILTGCTVSIVIISLFDHYFWTDYSGQILLVIYLGLASSFFSKSRLPAKKF